MRALLLSAALAAIALASRATAQPLLDPVQLDGLFDVEPTVEVNLSGSLLRLAAEASRGDEPEVATMIDNLRGITVRIYPLDAALGDVDAEVGQIGRQFEAAGWNTLVRVRARPDARLAEGEEDEDVEDEDVWVYVRDAAEAFDGLVVMTLDRTEGQAVFVHLDGTINPADVGRLSRRFGDVDVEADEGETDEADDEEDE